MPHLVNICFSEIWASSFCLNGWESQTYDIKVCCCKYVWQFAMLISPTHWNDVNCCLFVKNNILGRVPSFNYKTFFSHLMQIWQPLTSWNSLSTFQWQSFTIWQNWPIIFLSLLSKYKQISAKQDDAIRTEIFHVLALCYTLEGPTVTRLV